MDTVVGARLSVVITRSSVEWVSPGIAWIARSPEESAQQGTRRRGFQSPRPNRHSPAYACRSPADQSEGPDDHIRDDLAPLQVGDRAAASGSGHPDQAQLLIEVYWPSIIVCHS